MKSEINKILKNAEVVINSEIINDIQREGYIDRSNIEYSQINSLTIPDENISRIPCSSEYIGDWDGIISFLQMSESRMAEGMNNYDESNNKIRGSKKINYLLKR